MIGNPITYLSIHAFESPGPSDFRATPSSREDVRILTEAYRGLLRKFRKKYRSLERVAVEMEITEKTLGLARMGDTVRDGTARKLFEIAESLWPD